MLVIFVCAQQYELGFIIASYLTFLSRIFFPNTMDGKTALETYRPNLAPYEKVDREIHQNPGLSKQEVQTASIVASHLENLGDYIVHQGICGHGVVGILRNGKGPTVLLRADLGGYFLELLRTET